jgi:hypothetical protein
MQVAISWILNSSYDRVRAILSTKVFESHSLLLVPSQGPPFDQVQKLFFDEILQDGSRDRITSIVAHFEREIITGLAFIYRSNQRRTVGNTTTNDHQTVHVLEGGQIVRFSVAIRESAVAGLEVRFHILHTQSSYYLSLLFSFRSS